MFRIVILIVLFFASCGYPESNSEVSDVAMLYEVSQLSDDYLKIDHVNKIKVDMPISESEGIGFYNGILEILSSQESFSNSTKEGQRLSDGYPYLKNAPCAFSTAAALRFVAQATNTPKIRDVIRMVGEKNERIHTCTNEIEVSLRRLGFVYFDKNKWIAPKGAVGLLNDRSSNSSCHGASKTKSGHIYFIMVDRGPKGAKDVISDNFVRFNITYKAPGAENGTDGFWLPPGIVPVRRN